MRKLTQGEAAAVRAARPAMEDLANEYIGHAFAEWLAGRPDVEARARANAARDFCQHLANLAATAEVPT